MDKIEPYYLLKKFISKIPRGKVLDIGCGKGSNSIFLAKNGFNVFAIDLDKISISKLKNFAKKEKLTIFAKTADVKKFKFGEYSGVLALNCLQFNKKSERDIIINKIKQSVKSDGVILISTFTTKDKSYMSFSEKNKPVEKNTFYSKTENRYWNFFEPKELKSYFKDGFELLYYDEKVIKDARPVPHQHGIAEIVARKKNAS